MSLPDKIIKHRKAHGWSQEDFAEKLNVSRQAISRWENGTALPDAQNILQISKLFHVTTDYLLNDDYECDSDIPAVQSATKETYELVSRKKYKHLIGAIFFTAAWLFWVKKIPTYVDGIEFGIAFCCLVLCAANAFIQFNLFFKMLFKKR
ncbi:MAG: helix-turn-helix transcriptional regulator [Ruminococcaceae bacterium]|nr:helix-turn-helix transcriptional regulator [Oscillospiraceae bacterium]